VTEKSISPSSRRGVTKEGVTAALQWRKCCRYCWTTDDDGKRRGDDEKRSTKKKNNEGKSKMPEEKS